jgi:phosphoglucosamine mutase
MPRQLFGTDGIRGVAGEPPLDKVTVFCFGVALGEWAAAAAREPGQRPCVVVGRDTRESGEWLAGLVAAGLRTAGVETSYAGLTSTPGIAYLTRTGPYAAGVMISASHNPYHDNGLKAFDHSGFKLPDALEQQLEDRILALAATAPDPPAHALSDDPALDRLYLDHLASTVSGGLKGLRVVLDCANGSVSHLAPELFERVGAEVVRTGCAPDGRNINLDCGSLHVEALRERVLAERADCGAAFDGDADRCILVSASGRILDGDHALLVAGRDLHARGELGAERPAIVATVMSNLGLERALGASGIALLRTAVGDKYVLEEMVRTGLPLGGEQSGHVIFREFATTGDGMMTALRVLDAARRSGRTLDELVSDFTIYPQRLVNVRFRRKRPLDELPAVQEQIRATEDYFGPRGRVLVRFSGTEPLARVMVEGHDLADVETHARRIAAAIEEALNA